MELLSIGTFAALTRLSPKALRHYDDVDLLTPAHVDPVTGYRFYTASQLERARLVTWLRRLDMPLVRIRAICEMDRIEAAEAIRAFWGRRETELAAHRDLARFLVDELSGNHDTDPAHPIGADGVPLEIRYAVLSATGLVRDSNQDTAYADSQLLAVADGFGAGGEWAGQAAINALRSVVIEHGSRAGDLLNTLQDAVGRANHAIGDLGIEDLGEPITGEVRPAPGTTLTAMLWTGSRVALVHIGDSRAHLLRDGHLFQITHDHSFVQAMVDDGRLTPAEAASHPQRSLLLRALDGRAGPAADVRLHEARPGDRYLLCSDGLSAVVPEAEVARIIAALSSPEATVHELVDLAHTNGAPDNVSCVVADVVHPTVPDAADTELAQRPERPC